MAVLINWERERRREGSVGGFNVAYYGYESPSFGPDGLGILCFDDVEEVGTCFCFGGQGSRCLEGACCDLGIEEMEDESCGCSLLL